MLSFITEAVLELLMGLNTATCRHTTAHNLGFDAHCPSLAWKGLVLEGLPSSGSTA